MNEVEIPNKLREACDKAWKELKNEYGEDYLLWLVYIDHNLYYHIYNKLVDKYLKDEN